MIGADDVRAHTPAECPYDWAETRFFSVYLPDQNITAWVYNVARPGVGAFVCDIEAINRVGVSPLEAIYFDFRQHLPIPDGLDGFSLPNGLSLEIHNPPRDYHIRYTGHGGTEFDWWITGLMDPYDITDPAMDPLATGGDTEKTGFGTAYANHWDMTAHVTGTTKVRGRSFDTDCVTVADGSWGPRNEHLMRPMGWINASFGADYSLHTIWSGSPNITDSDDFNFAHGYVLIGAQLRGLKAGRLRATRSHHRMPVSYEMQLVDIDDHEHVLVGTPVAQHPWACYSNSYVPFSQLRWHTCHNGRNLTGYGIAQENYPLDRITGARFGVKSPTH